MALKDWFKPKSANKENIPVNAERSYNPFEMLNGSYFYPVNLNADQNNQALISMYNDIPEVASPLNYIMDKTSEIPLIHQRRKGEKWEDIKRSRVLDVLKNPNQFMDESLFRKQWILDFQLIGNAYINNVNAIGFGTSQLFLLPADRTEAILLNSNGSDYRLNEITGYRTTFNGVELKLPFDEVVHTREASKCREFYYEGTSRLMSAILTSQSLRYNYESRVTIYKNRGAMIMLTPKNENVQFQPEEAKALQHSLNNKFGTKAGSEPNTATSVPLDVNNISPDIKGLMLNENKLQDYQTICSVLKFPSILLNDNKNSAYNNKATALKQFYEDVSMPLNNVFCRAIHQAFGLSKDERIVADYSAISALQADENLKVQVNSTMYNDGVLSVNEYREDMEYEAITGGDQYKNQANPETNLQDEGSEGEEENN